MFIMIPKEYLIFDSRPFSEFKTKSFCGYLVKDVVNANILASSSSKVGSGEVINIGSGKNISINDLADMFGAEKKYLKPVNEPFANLADIRKAKELLNWEPLVDLDSWIKEYKLSNRVNII